jgi:hypothetical protein
MTSLYWSARNLGIYLFYITIIKRNVMTCNIYIICYTFELLCISMHFIQLIEACPHYIGGVQDGRNGIGKNGIGENGNGKNGIGENKIGKNGIGEMELAKTGPRWAMILGRIGVRTQYTRSP